MDQILATLNNPLIAFRLNRATDEHYHQMVFSILLGSQAATLVPRHRHLVGDLRPAFDALRSIYERAEASGQEIFAGTPEEVDEIEIGARIVEGIFRTTPLKTIRRAILKVRDQILSLPE